MRSGRSWCPEELPAARGRLDWTPCGLDCATERRYKRGACTRVEGRSRAVIAVAAEPDGKEKNINLILRRGASLPSRATVLRRARQRRYRARWRTAMCDGDR